MKVFQRANPARILRSLSISGGRVRNKSFVICLHNISSSISSPPPSFLHRPSVINKNLTPHTLTSLPCHSTLPYQSFEKIIITFLHVLHEPSQYSKVNFSYFFKWLYENFQIIYMKTRGKQFEKKRKSAD